MNKIYKTIFWITNIIIIIITCIVYLNLVLPFAFKEFLCYNNYITIKNIFSVNQKDFFYENYINYLLKNSTLNKNQQQNFYQILTETYYYNMLHNNFNLIKIKFFIKEILEIYIFIEKNYTNLFDYDPAIKESLLQCIIKKINYWLSIRR